MKHNMERSTDKLARYIMYLAGAAAIIAARSFNTTCFFIFNLP